MRTAQHTSTDIHSTIIEAMELIVSGSDDTALKMASHLGKALSMTRNQALLLSHFCSKSEDHRILLTEIAKQMGCNYLYLLRASGDIEELVNRRYLRRTMFNGLTTYAVNKEALTSLCQNKPYVYSPMVLKTFGECFGKACDLINDVRSHNIIPGDFMAELEDLLERCKKMPTIANLKKIKGITTTDFGILFFIANSLIADNDEDVSTEEMYCLFNSHAHACDNLSSMSDGSHRLIQAGLIEGHCEDGLFSAKYFRLTSKAKNLLFPGMHLKVEVFATQHLIKAESISAQKLFYDPDIQKYVDELATMLKPRKYKHVVERLNKCGLRKGIACLFYGEPGTGKTELVLQLARASGRDIFKVDASALRDKYVGESEKRIKAIFDEYRRACSQSKLTPILLFNEADAVLSKRLSNLQSSVDQMSNTCQNILLEEMENFEGIMIATTNLTTNLDIAFERRFLFKIEFGRPNSTVLAAIIKAKFPMLTKNESTTLANRHLLSGAEVENVARKANVHYAITGEEITLDVLLNLCDNETHKKKPNPIGFTK